MYEKYSLLYWWITFWLYVGDIFSYVFKNILFQLYVAYIDSYFLFGNFHFCLNYIKYIYPYIFGTVVNI